MTRLIFIHRTRYIENEVEKKPFGLNQATYLILVILLAPIFWKRSILVTLSSVLNMQ